MNIVDWILFTLLGLCVCYLLLYAIASKFYRAPHFPEARTFRRFVVFFPAYKEDRVIVSSARSFLEQDYPQELFPTKCNLQPMTHCVLCLFAY